MGIIIRQSVKTTIVNFVGVAIAAVSSLFIYPRFVELYGFAQFLISTASLFVPFASMGLIATVIKFHPKFKTEDKSNNGMLSMLLIGFLLIFSLFLLLVLSFDGPITDWLTAIGVDEKKRIPENLTSILILTALMVLNFILMAYATSHRRIVVPQIIYQLGLKIFMPVTILTFGLLAYSNMQFANALIAFYAVVCLLGMVYLIYIGAFKFTKPDWKFLNPDLRGEIFNYSLFSSWNHFGSMLAFRIDTVMIPMMMMTYASNGIYAIMLFMSNVIETPARAVKAIAAPIIADAWNRGDMTEINTLYKKSALNLVIPGIAIMIFIWFSFDGIASISPKPEKLIAGKYAFLFLGIGKLLDLITSVNDQIIIYSPKYKFNLIFILLLGVCNIILNYYLIGEYGITGAAIASCFAFALYNLFKLIFIYSQYKLHPFTTGLFKVLTIGFILTALLHFLPIQQFSFVDIIVNSLIVGLIYFPLIYFLNISPDFNKVCNIVLKRIRNFI